MSEALMRAIRAFWRSISDVRPGEGSRVFLMSLYLVFVLFAYYILKASSASLFLNRRNIEELPYLQVLIAAVGGVFAYLYTKVAVQASLKRAVAWTMSIAALCLVAFWWLLQYRVPWLLYAFNVWVSMFSIITVSQGWLVASNVFDSRQAKRLYGLLGLGAVVGAYLGSVFTAYASKRIGTLNLLLASAAGVVLAYGAFWMASRLKGVSLAAARGAEAEPEQFNFREIPAAIRGHRHLQVIVGIILLMLTVNSLFDYQFKAMAKVAHQGDYLTAFLANYQLWLTGIEFVLQVFLTSAVVTRIGVGGTLQIAPVTLTLASISVFAVPTLLVATIARLTEGLNRYTLNRTGLELLYLPLPAELRNRTKAFVDISMDRLGRGFGGIVLIVLNGLSLGQAKEIAAVSLVATLLWLALATLARREYVQTVRKRLESRRLDLESLRINVQDPTTVRLLEQSLASPNPRQAGYALSLLAEAPGYDLRPQLARLATHQAVEVRARVYELARALKFDGVLQRALSEVWASAPGQDGSIKPAVAYLLSLSSEATRLTKLFLDHPNWVVAEGALEALQRESAADFVTNEWLALAASDASPRRRCIAALAVGVRGDQGTEVLFKLLEDADPRVTAAACRAAGSVQNRAYLPALVRRLGEPRVRGVAVEALAAFGTRICGTLGDMLEDDNLPVAVRRQIPRVLRLIRDQRSANVLLDSVGHHNLSVRFAVLKALNQLRKAAPQLDYGKPVVTRQILEEARHYFQLNAALAPFSETRRPGTAACLLARTIEERLRQTLERLFRLLGLRYPPQHIYAAYLAVARRRSEDYAAALEFLDSVMERELKRVIMPLLDSSAHQVGIGRELFGVEPLTAEGAVRELIRSSDPWLKACAMATAGEQKMRGLREEISAAARDAAAEVTQVARAAVAALG